MVCLVGTIPRRDGRLANVAVQRDPEAGDYARRSNLFAKGAESAYSRCVPRVETAFLHAAAVHDAAAALHESAAELFDGLGKIDSAACERGHARLDREGAAADRERARLRREWLHRHERDTPGASLRHDVLASLARHS